MMSAPRAEPQPPTDQHPPPHAGTKRTATDSLESEQRLSKRFDLLNLDNNGKLYFPVPKQKKTFHTGDGPPISPPKKPTLPPVRDELMEVEDTPDRVYIHDLDAELSDIESDEENPIFLVDIEKHLAKIPKHVLLDNQTQQTLKATKDNQMVLYNVPTSLSVPEAQDNVRRAIEEARARIREKQALNPRDFELSATGSGVPNMDDGVQAPPSSPAAGVMKRPVQEDPDEMDMDEEL